MKSKFRVLVEQPTRGKRWVAVAADWPGLERGGKTEDLAVAKLVGYVPRYLPVAKRVRLGSQLTSGFPNSLPGSPDHHFISLFPSTAGHVPLAVRAELDDSLRDVFDRHLA